MSIPQIFELDFSTSGVLRIGKNPDISDFTVFSKNFLQVSSIYLKLNTYFATNFLHQNLTH